MLIAAKDAAEGLSETAVVALFGTSATVVVAIAGLIVTVLLARAAARRDRKKDRYRELVAIYTETGRMMTYVTQTIREMMIEGTKETPKTTQREVEKTQAAITAKFPELKDQHHAFNSLELYGAGQSVLDAHKGWKNTLTSYIWMPFSERTNQNFNEFLRAIDEKVTNFYRVAGEDARKALD